MTKNPYLDCRIRASKQNRTLRSRAAAAELLEISESSLSNYETGKTKVVPPDMVAQMSKVYKAPELRNEYCVNVCPIGRSRRLATKEVSIETVAVHLLKCLDAGTISEKMAELLTVAQDGDVSENIQCLKNIYDVLDRITYAVSEFQVFVERRE